MPPEGPLKALERPGKVERGELVAQNRQYRSPAALARRAERFRLRRDPAFDPGDPTTSITRTRQPHTLQSEDPTGAGRERTIRLAEPVMVEGHCGPMHRLRPRDRPLASLWEAA